MPNDSVQQAHDALLALRPAGAAHDDCSLCAPGGQDSELEEALVAEAAAAPTMTIAGNQYSEAQHFSLVKSAVEQETASLQTEKAELAAKIETLESEKAALATELSEAKSKADLLEADKATAEAAAQQAVTDLESFKTEISRKEEIAALKNDRKAQVQAANASLADEFFTDERIQRWAEMSAEAFEAFVADMTEMAKFDPAVFDKNKKKKKDDEKEDGKEKSEARETAAFTGGTEPMTPAGSTLGAFLTGLTTATHA